VQIIGLFTQGRFCHHHDESNFISGYSTLDSGVVGKGSLNYKSISNHLISVVCNFNVDLGPEIEFVYPASVDFSTQDLTNICFSSFPERHESGTLGDIYFTYTLVNNSLDINLNSPLPPYGSPHLLYASCVFRQEYDKLSKRSYNQKSLVIIANHEFPAFFMNILRTLVSGASIGNVSRLEVACAQLASWMPPRIGKQELPFLGTLLDLDMSVSPYYLPAFQLNQSTVLPIHHFHSKAYPHTNQLNSHFSHPCHLTNPRNTGTTSLTSCHQKHLFMSSTSEQS